MVARAGGYYVEPFHRERGVTQGDPLLPTISNVVVDAVVHHRESLVAEGADRDDSSSNEVAQLARETLRARND